jgi:hypothetical protein
VSAARITAQLRTRFLSDSLGGSAIFVKDGIEMGAASRLKVSGEVEVNSSARWSLLETRWETTDVLVTTGVVVKTRGLNLP